MQNGEFWTNSVCVGYMLLLYVQKCNSVQSGAFIKLSASGNPTYYFQAFLGGGAYCIGGGGLFERGGLFIS